jgi:hypothetical protein
MAVPLLADEGPLSRRRSDGCSLFSSNRNYLLDYQRATLSFVVDGGCPTSIALKKHESVPLCFIKVVKIAGASQAPVNPPKTDILLR